MSKNIEENIDEFTKLVQDIKLTGDKNIDDYTPIVLLNAIPDVYSDVKAAIKYEGTVREEVEVEVGVGANLDPGMTETKMIKQKKEDAIIVGLKVITSKIVENQKWIIGRIIIKKTLMRYVPDLNHNLMSCAALEEEGLEVDYDILATSVTDFDKTSLWHKRKWKILVENQTGKKLEVLRTDNGLEFCNQSFSNYVMNVDKKHDNLDITFNKVGITNRGEENEELGTEFPENNNSEGLDDYLLARDRNRREPRIPARYNDFHIALNIEPYEPSSVEEALKSENSKNWLSVMAEEMKSLKDNNTWVLVPKPKSCSVVDCKWIFKIKEEDTSKRFKARLVAKGFTQKEGIGYTEIFSPVVKYTTVRIILALTAHFNWELKHMDVKTAFLHVI
ncbi:UNVERIFIED_CONTAM: Retrovirus-related Pol polyprotein from transposon TNT 1-94 [Sesamum calycinum]|uniref:Retrovirus-related Pol polyprotein from transposon TNT 1-94 n=1 Tax=Sesamum calycinum TaxID=2727403 RepID=A0AAW2NJR1_9LAMI